MLAEIYESSEQAPGPRGSPQEPHGPAAGALDFDPDPATLKTESCCSSLVLLHAGQAGFCEPCSKASNFFEHSLQIYS
jgi:hypothetical protein